MSIAGYVILSMMAIGGLMMLSWIILQPIVDKMDLAHPFRAWWEKNVCKTLDSEDPDFD